MARPQANDYDQKRNNILTQATILFASKGFHATSISDISGACNTSKSRLYHYFNSKEQVLYEILKSHAQTLVDTFLPIMSEKDISAREKLEKYARHLLRINVKSRAQHKLILSELDALPVPQRQEIADLLRQHISAIYGSLAEVNPNLTRSEHLRFPVAMMFLGMVNWSHTWFSDDGDVSIEMFATLICDTFISGFSSAKLPV